MVFSESQIKTALSVDAGSKDANPENSLNYQLIIDYLTGRIDSLKGIRKEKYYSWHGLLALLKNVDTRRTTGDQLILNIIHHHEFLQYTKGAFEKWLNKYLAENPGDISFRAVLSQFSQMGMSDFENRAARVFRFPTKQKPAEATTGLKTKIPVSW